MRILGYFAKEATLALAFGALMLTEASWSARADDLPQRIIRELRARGHDPDCFMIRAVDPPSLFRLSAWGRPTAGFQVIPLPMPQCEPWDAYPLAVVVVGQGTDESPYKTHWEWFPWQDTFTRFQDFVMDMIYRDIEKWMLIARAEFADEECMKEATPESCQAFVSAIDASLGAFDRRLYDVSVTETPDGFTVWVNVCLAQDVPAVIAKGRDIVMLGGGFEQWGPFTVGRDVAVQKFLQRLAAQRPRCQ